jgi:soluble lytic murein transglycosylase-like protein
MTKVLNIKKIIRGIILFLLLSILVTPASYASNTTASTIYLLKEYIRIVEYQNHIPGGLLKAIIEVESGFNPYALNINGKTITVSDRTEAIHTIRNALNAGITNIDIGVGQINYRWHGDNFKGIEEMLNPVTNIEYAAKLLSSLFKEHGDWFKALKYYHSAKAQYQLPYSKKIFVAWLGDGNYSTKF